MRDGKEGRKEGKKKEGKEGNHYFSLYYDQESQVIILQGAAGRVSGALYLFMVNADG